MNQLHPFSTRLCDPRRDLERLLALDVTYSSPGCLVAASCAGGLELIEHRWAEERVQSFPIEPTGTQWQVGWVAEIDERLIGFIAVEFEPWNRRLSIWHYYVDAIARRQGVGRLLMQLAVDYGISAGAKVAWAETSNCNLPGIEVYKRLGFHVCGFDASLYCGTPSEGQFAVFLARVLTKDTRLALQSAP